MQNGVAAGVVGEAAECGAAGVPWGIGGDWRRLRAGRSRRSLLDQADHAADDLEVSGSLSVLVAKMHVNDRRTVRCGLRCRPSNLLGRRGGSGDSACVGAVRGAPRFD